MLQPIVHTSNLLFQAEYFEDDTKYAEASFTTSDLKHKEFHDVIGATSLPQQEFYDDKLGDFVKKTHFVDSLLRSDLVLKSTTESSVTTVISTLTKSSDDEPKSIVEDGTSADLSKISGADLAKDLSKTSMDTRDESRTEDQMEDRGTPDLSKKSIDLTKDYSKSSIDSKDTSRDFATNELSKDSTVDLTKDFSKVSIDSVKETSRSIDEKTFSEEHSSLDVSKTLASDASDAITKSREFLDEERSLSRMIHISTSSSQETSVMTESKVFSELDDKSLEKGKLSQKVDGSKGGDTKEIKQKIDNSLVETKKITFRDDAQGIDIAEDTATEKSEKEDEIETPDMSELNRRCSNLLEDISSQGALIRIDSSHVTHGNYI